MAAQSAEGGASKAGAASKSASGANRHRSITAAAGVSGVFPQQGIMHAPQSGAGG